MNCEISWGAWLARLGAGMAFCGLLGGCQTQTYFQSNFSSTALGQPPAHAQAVGTADVDAQHGGSVTVVADPLNGGERWVRIANPTGQQVAFQGLLSNLTGDGTYTFLASFFVPSPGSAASPETAIGTVQFERWQSSIDYYGFLHLDFLPSGRIRIDDNMNTEFGTYPFDRPFVLAVTLNIGAAPNAHVGLLGSGASGSTDYAISSTLAHQFGAIRLWQGYQWRGSFEAAGLLVSKRTD